MKVLITGANGFLGSHLVEKALKKGFETSILIRPGANLSNLQHLRGYQVIEVSYNSAVSIAAAIKDLPAQDLVIHNAGLIKSYTLEGYVKVNVALTERLIEAIQQCLTLSPSGRFAYISSLAAKGPVGNDGPASNYGRSKLMAEEAVRSSGIKYMIYRPTGIYGARDVQFVPLIKAVKLGLYPSMTPKAHKMTLINASDVAENVLECSLKHENETVHLEDGHVYQHEDLKAALEKLLSKKSINLRVGRPVVKALLSISDLVDRNLKRTPKLSREHYSEISQDWDYDFSEERKKIPLTIEYSLEDGFKSAIDYYLEKDLI
ncbi:NAD-dependent epimerase/dehydratase family protein [Marinoscillum sp.]|uniref:NAD-dependent epimerase/dehydratase family protein n=1 Tax=Marinoscillum sp. TaxID=2024838 RepID=UPI003BAAD6C7